MNYIVELLDRQDLPSVVDTLVDAFGDHPMLPAGTPEKRFRRFLECVISTYFNAQDATLLGISIEDGLACAAFVHDADYEPKGWRLISMLAQMYRTLGWSMLSSFIQISSQKPIFVEKQLELFLIGTRSAAQRAGMGRAMLGHVLDFAVDHGYESVILEVATETPALEFYLREGFRIEKEISIPTCRLCYLRRSLA